MLKAQNFLVSILNVFKCDRTNFQINTEGILYSLIFHLLNTVTEQSKAKYFQDNAALTFIQTHRKIKQNQDNDPGCFVKAKCFIYLF